MTGVSDSGCHVFTGCSICAGGPGRRCSGCFQNSGSSGVIHSIQWTCADPKIKCVVAVHVWQLSILSTAGCPILGSPPPKVNDSPISCKFLNVLFRSAAMCGLIDCHIEKCCMHTGGAHYYEYYELYLLRNIVQPWTDCQLLDCQCGFRQGRGNAAIGPWFGLYEWQGDTFLFHRFKQGLWFWLIESHSCTIRDTCIVRYACRYAYRTNRVIWALGQYVDDSLVY